MSSFRSEVELMVPVKAHDHYGQRKRGGPDAVFECKSSQYSHEYNVPIAEEDRLVLTIVNAARDLVTYSWY